MKKQYVEHGTGKMLKTAAASCADKMKELIAAGYRIVHFQYEVASYQYIILYEDNE